MAIINCIECGKETSDKAETCPHCGVRIAEPVQNPNLCQKCNTPYITEQKNASFSPIFIISVPLFILGLLALLFNWVIGLLAIAVAFIIDYVGRKKKTVLICPKCRFEPY